MAICSARHCSSWLTRPFLVALLALAAIPAARAQTPQPPSPLDSLAARMADAIHKNPKFPFSTPNILVADFVETQGPSSELGAELAREFSDYLKKHARGFNVLDRAEYLKKFAADKLSADSYDKPETMKCYAMEFGAMAVVTGSLDDFSDRVLVRVEATRIADRKIIFDERISLPLTPEMQASISMPARLSPSSSSSDKPASGGSDRSSLSGDKQSAVPRAGTKDYTMPSCIYCPSARYSDAGSKAKVQGTILLDVQIGSSGSAENISVVHGLPCGMNQSAIDAVAHWKFKPANGPDGKPAVVRIPIEVDFRLY
jgi:TonB family protein